LTLNSSSRGAVVEGDVDPGVSTLELQFLLIQATERPPAMSILALRGLGRELWSEIDAAAHVETERRAWD